MRALKIHEARHRRDDAGSKPAQGKFACPWCNTTTEHGRGLSQHAKKTHNKRGDELYMARFPQCKTTCTDCESPVPFKNQEVGYPERCSKCSRRYSYATKNITSWNKGLTKETDKRMADSAANMRKHYATHGHHSTGKTKENDERVRLKARKISMTKKGKPHTPRQKEAHRGKHSICQDEAKRRFAELGFTLVGEYAAALKPVEVTCTKCDKTTTKKLHVLEHGGKCNFCFSPKISRWQSEIADYVRTLISDVEVNNRNVIAPYELDIYVPSRSFAIECNGIYWHSDAAGQHDPKHAEKKRILAKNAGINLLTIFEDEWRDKRHIIESMIRHRLGLSTRIGARKLTVQRCAVAEASHLLNEWHLEGYVNSSYALKMVTKEGNIVGVCSLRWARGTNRTILEIARIAFHPGVHVSGGISKFIAEVYCWGQELKAQKLLSYSDNRLGNGSGYLASGMQFDGLTVPRFWWTDFFKRYNRFKYRADKERSLTEKQVAKEAGVVKIYGCSNSRWILNVSS